MLGKAGQLGCSPNDVKCLCNNQNFGFGIRDCSAALCNQADMQKTITFGQSFCQGE